RYRHDRPSTRMTRRLRVQPPSLCLLVTLLTRLDVELCPPAFERREYLAHRERVTLARVRLVDDRHLERLVLRHRLRELGAGRPMTRELVDRDEARREGVRHFGHRKAGLYERNRRGHAVERIDLDLLPSRAYRRNRSGDSEVTTAPDGVEIGVRVENVCRRLLDIWD